VLDFIAIEWQDAVREKILSGDVQSSEAVAIRKDGSAFPIEYTTRHIPYQGHRVKVTTIRDITERQKVERLKHEFISTVSHELRTPLTSIRGSLGLIAGGMVGEFPPQAKTMLDIAYKNSERLVLLINDILDIEKIESGQMSFNLQPLELLPLVEQALEANRAYGDQYKVKFVLGTTLPQLKVKTDSNRLMQVLANLLSNAAKFSEPGDTVVVAMARQGQDVRVSVTDHGPGIPKEFQERIFQKFAQADASSTRQKGGSGLGLSIAKAIIERSGGRIGYETASGVGTTFYFDLPVYQEKKPALSRPNQPSILIVEDDHDVASLLGLLLGHSGFSTEIACDAAEAKKLLSRTKFDAMTLDLMLPGQDGLSLLRELRQQPATRNLPIVIVSAKKKAGNAHELDDHAIAVIDWIDKPIKQKQLISAVKRATRKVESERPKILHIEDDYDVLGVVALLLRDVAEVNSATTLAEAQQKINLSNYDLVLLDLELPDGNGLNLLQDLQKSPIPVVIFSASEVSGDLSRKVAAALVKSRTSNRELLNTIRGLVGFIEPVSN
jgi:signal transduction histidine kinase/CheY-like chemotaxis protein